MTYFDFLETVEFEGPGSKNPLAFNYYQADKKIGKKTMAEHLRFSMAYWHSLTEDGSDPFGNPTMDRPWNNYQDSMDRAEAKVEAAFELMSKLGINYFCFHDVDVAPEGATIKESNENLEKMAELLKKKMEATGIKLLWGTSNLFSHPIYMHGAATSPQAKVFACAAAKVKKAIEVTKYLGGENYVFWGGREGYETLLNTNMKLEQDNLARFFYLVIEYAEKIGFNGQFLIEPKPKEPTKHQYDFDCASVLAFLRKYDLEGYFKLNIEANHATLAGHTFQHELRYARINDMLGSVDANQGDLLLGWDTDQFPSNLYNTSLAMYEVLKNGGLAPGGLNFDAKVRRGSYQLQDLVQGHILGMDSFAKGLEVAHSLINSQEIEDLISSRYKSYQEGLGSKIVEENTSLEELAEIAQSFKLSEIKTNSGSQEKLEAILNRHLLGSLNSD